MYVRCCMNESTGCFKKINTYIKVISPKEMCLKALTSEKPSRKDFKNVLTMTVNKWNLFEDKIHLLL